MVLRNKKWEYLQPSEGPEFLPNTGVESGNSLNPQLYNMKYDRSQNINVADYYQDTDFPTVIEKSRCYPDSKGNHELYGDFDSEEMLRKDREAYYTACTIVDESIGKVLSHLEILGKKEETLIIFTSDHGEMMGDKGYYSKNSPYEVPFVFP